MADSVRVTHNSLTKVAQLVTLPDTVPLGTGGATETTLADVKTSVQIMDDWDESDRAKVNPIVGQAGVAAGAGAVGATVQRTTLASDDPAVTALQIIDDWDESDRAKVNPIAGQAGVAGGAGATGATTQRVVLATDTLPPIGGTYTDRSIANLSGSSEQLMAANASRRVLVIHNIGATSVAVNLTGGTASLSAGGSVTLTTLQSLVLDHYPPTSAITIIGTASADVTAYEG